MLDIKQARPRKTYDAVYVTKDNVDEFIKMTSYGRTPVSIDRFDSVTIYRYDLFSSTVYHDYWYVHGSDGWERQFYFDDDFEIVDEV